MESLSELKEIDIKNITCYYFDDIIKTEYFNIINILIDEKPYENTLVYKILYKSLIDSKPLRIRFDKINGLVRVYMCESYDSIKTFRIRYLISVKCYYIYNFS